MIQQLMAITQSVQVLSTLLKAANGLRNFNEFVAAISEINAQLLNANAAALASQKEQLTLSNRVRELEEKIMSMENWNSESERYQLAELCPGVVHYVLKPSVDNSEPSHTLCANCFSKRQKGYLQKTIVDGRGTWYKCGNCDKEITDFSHPLVLSDISHPRSAWT